MVSSARVADVVLHDAVLADVTDIERAGGVRRDAHGLRVLRVAGSGRPDRGLVGPARVELEHMLICGVGSAAGVGDEQVAVAVGGDALRLDEAGVRELAQVGARRGEPLDSLVAVVHDVDIGAVDRHVARAVELAVTRPVADPDLRQVPAVGVELLDDVEGAVGHVDVSRRFGRDPQRRGELRVPGRA